MTLTTFLLVVIKHFLSYNLPFAPFSDIYHLNFDPPTDDDVTARLQEVPGNSEKEMIQRLRDFHSCEADLLRCFQSVIKTINADQPMADVFGRSMEFTSTIARSVAPRTPRVILIGPPGAGKDTQAALLASKYNVVNMNCGHLIRQEIADETKLGAAMASYVNRKTPGEVLHPVAHKALLSCYLCYLISSHMIMIIMKQKWRIFGIF